MKTLITNLLLVLTLVLCGGCAQHDINGDLDGQWHLISIEKADGEIVEPSRVYYAFQLHTYNIHCDGANISAGRFDYDEKARTLVLHVPAWANPVEAGLPEGPCSVPFGINAISRQNLTMTYNGEVFTFRKF